MFDADKVIDGLECCREKTCNFSHAENVCPYLSSQGEHKNSYCECTTRLAADVLILLGKYNIGPDKEELLMFIEKLKSDNNELREKYFTLLTERGQSLNKLKDR